MSQGQERIKCFPSALFIFYILLLFKDTSSASKHSGPPSSAKKPILTFDTSQDSKVVCAGTEQVNFTLYLSKPYFYIYSEFTINITKYRMLCTNCKYFT